MKTIREWFLDHDISLHSLAADLRLVTAICFAANVARRVGLQRAAWKLAAIAWDVADHSMRATSDFSACRTAMPWSCGAETAWTIANAMQRGGAR